MRSGSSWRAGSTCECFAYSVRCRFHSGFIFKDFDPRIMSEIMYGDDSIPPTVGSGSSSFEVEALEIYETSSATTTDGMTERICGRLRVGGAATRRYLSLLRETLSLFPNQTLNLTRITAMMTWLIKTMTFLRFMTSWNENGNEILKSSISLQRTT